MQENNFHVSEHSLKTAISNVEPNKLTTRGYNQQDLIEQIRYGDMIYLILKGRLPSIKESKMFNHVLVSFCDHGVTPPSTQTARIIASSGSPLNSAVAGALLSFGHKHAGAIEKTMELYQTKINSLILTEDTDLDNKQIASLAIDIYNDYYSKKEKLIQMAIKEGFVGPHIKLAVAIEDLIYENKGIKLNVDGANAAILSDLGFTPDLGLGIFIIGRIPGIIAHIHEENMDEDEFRRFCELSDIEYGGR